LLDYAAITPLISFHCHFRCHCRHSRAISLIFLRRHWLFFFSSRHLSAIFAISSFHFADRHFIIISLFRCRHDYADFAAIIDDIFEAISFIRHYAITLSASWHYASFSCCQLPPFSLNIISPPICF
jgi:hypothetical protein